MICLREVVGDEVVDLLEVRLQAAARSGWALLLEIINYRQDYHYHQQLIFKVEIVALYLSWTLS